MAQIDQQNTAQLDWNGREADALSQPSQDPFSARANEDVGNQSPGGCEEGKEVKCSLGELSPPPANLNASDQVDRPEPLAVTSFSSSSSLASAVALTPARPNLVQSQSHFASTATHPKKFSSVNINKKFLEKTNSASTTATTMTSTSTSAKASGSTVSRPPAQSSSPHSRLVTTKLTATASSPSSAPGWSRPSSTGPSATATGANSPNTQTPAPSVPSNPPPSSSAPAPAAPPLPHPGKVIQPVPQSASTQQHAAVTTGPVKETGSNNSSTLSSKPVWGNLRRSSTTSSRPDVTVNDFPTAAEVALGMRKSKPVDQPVTDATPASSTTTLASKRNEEADTFRGVHLDPNAHHWDEMVEDDDNNYWDNVIEFDDGRQYKVEAVEQTKSRSREASPPTSVKSSHSARLEPVDVPVSKEERFADDFDRSWPGGTRRAPPAGVQPRSPQESSRVLFNERSNKLEPYSTHRAAHGPFPAKRGSFQERNMSPTESRSGSGFHLHGAPRTTGGPPADFGLNRSRRFSNASNSSFVAPSERDRRDRRDGAPVSPRIPKDNVGLMGRTPSLRGRDRDGERDLGTLERGRHSAMGPPPIPPHAWRNSSKDSTKQHLSTPVSANGPAPPFSAGGRRLPSDDTGPFNQNEQPDFPGSSPIIRGHPHSPALSHASTKAAWISPATASSPLPAVDGHNLEEMKKDVMHSAAERAKQRRQQEEEEREAQKERARKKAAELEAKMKAETEEKAQNERARNKAAELEAKMKAETEEKARKEEAANPVEKEQEEREEKEQDSSSAKKEAEVLAIINEAVGGEASSDVAQLQRTTSKPAHRRVPGPNDLIQPRRFNSTGGSVASPSVAETADTWRRATPLPRQPDEPRLIQRRSSNSVAFLPPPPPAPLDHVQTLADGKKEDLEVVDFTDMGKFVGETPEQKETPRKAPRPVASDFFSDLPSPALSPQALPPSIRNDIETWRRKTPLNQGLTSDQSSSTDRREAPPATDSPIVAEQVHKTNEGIADARQPNVSPSSSLQRPRPQSYYHQAPMSSLVDAMSRIKGAIHDMQAGEMSKDNVDTPLASQAQPTQTSVSLPSKYKERWVPHSQRVKRVENQEESPEEAYTTAVEPPHSPPPSPGPIVKLPSVKQRESVLRRRLLQFYRQPFPVHFDILSFDPPVEGMTKRNLSVNDVLFRPFGYKGKTKYFVRLPKSRNTGTRNHTAMQTGVRNNSFGAFGKQADTATSWRKSTSQPPQADSASEPIESTSRSPPPEPESLPKNDKQGESENSAPPPRMRSQPKMPEGSCVAFYRDSRVDVPNTEPKIVVNFIVSSEIDDSHGSQSQAVTKTKEVATDPSGSSEPIKEIKGDTAEARKNSDVPVLKLTTDASKLKTTASPAESDPSPLPSVAEKNSDKSSHQSSPWPTTKNLPLKESPARAPDPEHLKAVWSQTTNDKAGLQPVNSLEGIADDLTSLPFTIQDVKSEDGETPPPPLSGPSSMRMSLHDVTRAFQQVPSSSSAPHKPSISPPSTTAPVARPAVPNFAYPVPPNNMRPAYAAYPSPMMSHSPSPTMMYPHVVSSPVPGRMQPNGHAPMYNPPPHMWVPVQPSVQNSNGMMRPMASPYAATMMPYPTNGAPPMFPPPMPTNVPGTPQSQNLQANRNRNMPMMSPVMQHAGAPGMYPASPAMMHIQMTPTSGYMPLPTGRGQPRPENGQMAMQQSNSVHPPTHVGLPHSPFMRSW
ncbi:hypothetical protein JOM56_005893 [Amanita muscaria]